MTMRDPSEVIAACPFCGNDVQEDEGCFQSGGFRSPSTPVFVVRCGNPECNAETAATNAADAIAAWNRRALPASTPPGDPCVRHACKRVRMEMQARIDALSASGDAVAQRDAYIGVQARALGVAEAKLDRVDKVLREFEGLTGAGYRYMAEHVRAAMNPKESSHA